MKILIIFLFLLISCSENKFNEEKREDENLEVEIVSKKTSSLLSKALENNNEVLENYFSKELIENFKKYNINVYSVLEAERLSLNGDIDSINNLTYVYDLINDSKKFKDILLLGEKFKNDDSIFNLAILEFQNDNFESSLNYLSKLTKDYKINDVKNLKISIYRKKAYFDYKEKKYEKAIENLIKVYQIGDIDVAYDISGLYFLLADENNYLKWLEISSENNILASKRLANIYYNNQKYKEAILEYNKIFEKGEFLVARNIYLSYKKLDDINETIKWYKIAKNLGIVDIDNEIEEIMKIYGR